MDTFVFSYETRIQASMKQVWDFFSDPTNLEAVQSFPKVSVQVKEEEEVNVRIHLLLFRIQWSSVITDVRAPYFFTDEAKKPPFPFSYWKHTHRFRREGEEIVLTDEIAFRSKLPARLIERGLKTMFKARKTQIQRLFDDEK
ncbi:SRPBCC family protein [Shouchella shacheensis]|uniref:SRPBCC family protein n=1 Tax=Shouchella shacheensis TaxID=1649580 RepID=UPI0007402D62|nr:hypothetical protein [Shouchella shacheensis]